MEDWEEDNRRGKNGGDEESGKKVNIKIDGGKEIKCEWKDEWDEGEEKWGGREEVKKFEVKRKMCKRVGWMGDWKWCGKKRDGIDNGEDDEKCMSGGIEEG